MSKRTIRKPTDESRGRFSLGPEGFFCSLRFTAIIHPVRIIVSTSIHLTRKCIANIMLHYHLSCESAPRSSHLQGLLPPDLIWYPETSTARRVFRGGRPLYQRQKRVCGPHGPSISFSQTPSTSPSSFIPVHLHVRAVVIFWAGTDTTDCRLLTELKLLAGRA